MRFDRVRLSHFGGLHHLDTGDETLGPLVVIHGPNESGKSTFFHFLTSMLYGFRPASSTQHPYAPWSGDEIEGEAIGTLDDGRSWSVIRRLRSNPWGRLQTDGAEVELRNRTLPFIEHVPRTVFQKVFALTLHELGGLDGETWATLQDRLLARMTTDDLRPTRDVMNELRTEANALWRPDQRGRPRARDITSEMLELQRERRAAAERDQDLRKTSEALGLAKLDLEKVRRERLELRASVERLERLLPAQRLLTRIRRLEAEVEPALLDGLPSDPVEALSRLRDEVDRKTQALSALELDIAGARAACPDPGPADQALLGEREALEARTEEFEVVRDLRTRRESARDGIRALSRRIDSLARGLFDPAGPAWTDDAVTNLPLSTLSDETVRLRNLRGDRRAREEATMLESPRPFVGGERLGLVSLLGGIGLVAVGAVTSGTAATALGLVLVVLAALLMALRWDRTRRLASGPSGADLERVRRAEASSLARIQSSLGNLPLREEVLADPQPELIARLDELASRLQERHERADDLNLLEDRIGSIDARTLAALARAGIVASESSPERPLLSALAAAVARDTVRLAASKELDRLEVERNRTEDVVQVARAALAELEERLAPFGDGDPVSGAQSAQAQLVAAIRSDEARAELAERHDSEDEIETGLATLETELGSAIDDDALDRFRQQLAAVQEREIRLSERVTGLERDVTHLEKERTVSVLDGEIEALKGERQVVLRERDRLALLGTVVEEADRRFRDRHQPDVVRRSAEYLSWITNSRYERLTTGDRDGDGHLMLQTGAGRSVDVNGPLSTGTKEQVLLALRLAVADHLDQASERMPLFIDEAFVNWDDGRQNRGLELVSRLSEGRQVFVFTCHDRLADTLAGGGGKLVRLDRLPG